MMVSDSATGKRGRPAKKQQKASIIQTVLDLVRQQLTPLRHAIQIILQKLQINYTIEPCEIILPNNHQKTRRQRRSKKKEVPKPERKQDENILDGLDYLDTFEAFDFDDAFSLENIIPPEEQTAIEAQTRQDFVFPQPRGNNSNFNLAPLPSKAPVEDIREQHREQWSRLYLQVKRLLEGKRAKGERGWFDFEKKMLLELVMKGSQFGASINNLTLMLGVSHSTLKRWRNYFK